MATTGDAVGGSGSGSTGSSEVLRSYGETVTVKKKSSFKGRTVVIHPSGRRSMGWVAVLNSSDDGPLTRNGYLG